MPLAPFAALPADNTSLPIVVDGNPADWPVTVDIVGDRALMTVSSDTRGQHALLDQLDNGDYARLQFAEDHVIWFSLLGSRRAAVDASDRCRSHQPEEWKPSGAG